MRIDLSDVPAARETGAFERARVYESKGVEALWVYGPDHDPEAGLPAHPAVALYSAPATGFWVGIAVYSDADECYKQLQTVAGEDQVRTGSAITTDPVPPLVNLATDLMAAASGTDDVLSALQDAADERKDTLSNGRDESEEGSHA